MSNVLSYRLLLTEDKSLVALEVSCDDKPLFNIGAQQFTELQAGLDPLEALHQLAQAIFDSHSVEDLLDASYLFRPIEGLTWNFPEMLELAEFTSVDFLFRVESL